MVNTLKKVISVLSASAIVASIVPMALASSGEVYYNEGFESITDGTLVQLDTAGQQNDTYETDLGLTFKCAGSRSGDSAQVGIKKSGEYLDIFAYKYNDKGARRPYVELSRSTGVTFESDMVVKMDAEFVGSDAALVLRDSKSAVFTYKPGITGKWLSITIGQTADATYVVASDIETGATVDFTKTTSTLTDVSQIGPADLGTATNELYIDNLYVADETFELPDDVVMDAALEKINISTTQPGMTYDSNTKIYTVKKDVTLPADPDGATVNWVVSQSDSTEGPWTDTSYAKILDGKVVLAPEEGSENYFVKVTADVTVGSLEKTKDFIFVVVPSSATEPVQYYNEDFSGFSGTIVNLGTSENTDYESTYGLSFTCGARSSDVDQIGIKADNGALSLFELKYTDQSRNPVMTLSRTSGIKVNNNLVIKLDVTFAKTTDILNFIDSQGNEFALTPINDTVLAKQLTYTIAQINGTSTVIVEDSDKHVVSYYTSANTLSDLKKITISDKVSSTILIDNLYISDEVYKIPDSVIVDAGVKTLDLTNLTATDGVYKASTDFDLPAAPEGTTVAWTVMQKAKDSTTWEPSTFLAINGTSVTINPTADIDNYDVKLVATVSAGEASATKDFALALPNPMDEINGILNNKFSVVDTAESGITYDLASTNVLKYDLKLPISYKAYKNTTVAWTTSDDSHVAIAADGTATIMTTDLNTHDVTVTGVVTYKKGEITYSSAPQVYNIKMGYTADDVASDDASLGTYKVRFDDAYAANFSGIPTSTSSDVSLPEKGYFGSKISWSSSIPTTISNTGKYKKPSASQNVVMTGIITNGAASKEKSFTIYVAGSSNSGGGGGGGSSSSTGTTNSGSGGGTIATNPNSSIPVDSTTSEEKIEQLKEELAQANDLFKDLSQAAWARDAINGLAKAGVVNGRTDTLFVPNGTVTRAEFAKMLMGAFSLTANTYKTSSFNDVATDIWYFAPVETAYNLGIITGVEDGMFAPNELITRQDMAVMVARAAAIAGKTISTTAEDKPFADASSISDYAQAPVEQLVKGGIISGMSDTEFAPLQNATRAQAAKILFNFL